MSSGPEKAFLDLFKMQFPLCLESSTCICGCTDDLCSQMRVSGSVPEPVKWCHLPLATLNICIIIFMTIHFFSENMNANLMVDLEKMSGIVKVNRGQLCALAFWSFFDRFEDIIMGTHKEGGATTFWSYTLNLPLSSNSMISWKFCYLLHKVLRDGHRNVSLNLYIPSNLLFTTWANSLSYTG